MTRARKVKSLLVNPPPQPFLPQAFPTRQALVVALGRMAHYCRDTISKRGSPRLIRHLMRFAALSKEEAHLRNRYLFLKRAWLRAGCPQPYPWDLLESHSAKEAER